MQTIEFHENMIGADNGPGKPYLKKWAKRMIAQEAGFVECTENYEKAIVAISRAFSLAQQLKNKI